MLDHLGTWSDMLPLVEFMYNNSYHSSIGMAPYEALYGRRFKTPFAGNKIESRWCFGQNFYNKPLRKSK